MSKPNIFNNNTYYRHNEPIRSYEEQAREFAKGLIVPDNKIDEFTDSFMRKYDRLVYEFENKTKLKKLDLSIMIFAACLQILRWAMTSNESLLGNDIKRPNAKTVDDLLNKPKQFAQEAVKQSKVEYDILGNKGTVQIIPPQLPKLIEDFMAHKVPYDVTKVSTNYKLTHPGFMPGISGFNHRYKVLGHDPLAGFIFGTANIVTSTLSVNAPKSLFPSYIVKNSEIDDITDIYHVMKSATDLVSEEPLNVAVAFKTQALHIGSDVFTKAGLPVPILNNVSPEASEFLMGHHIDTLSVTRSAALAITINKIVEMFHKLFYDQRRDQANLYEVKTRKVVMYSNVMSSLLNVGWVAGTGDIDHLDVGGIAVTLWRVLTDTKRIEQIKAEFIERELDNDFRKQEEEIKQRLAVLGFEY